MPISTLLIDLDDTVYPFSSGLWGVIKKRIDLYMLERMHLPADDIPQLRTSLFTQYGTTMRGLQTLYHVDERDYLAFVHDVPVGNYLTPDPALRAMLKALPQRKVIFTNADRGHAARVLHALDLEGVFEQVIDILDISPYCKPMQEAFDIVLKRLKIDDPRSVLMADDGVRNLAAAHNQGMATVRVGSEEPGADYDAAIMSLVKLPAVLDCLEKSEV